MTGNWGEAVDILIAGTGAGGLATAVLAAAKGARVLVVEKAARVGGTTRKSAGFMWIPNNHFMQAAGLEDPRDGALRYMARLSRPLHYDPDHETLGLERWEFEGLQAHYDNAADAIRALVDLDAIDVSHAAEFPDFYCHLPEDEAPVGRTIFPTGGGGGPTGGAVLVKELHAAAERAGVEFRFETSLKGLIRDDDGAVIGAQLGGAEDGVRVRTRQGVIAATGCFAQNEELRIRYLDRPYVATCTAETNTGDFLAMSRDAGADFASLNLAMQAPILVERLEREGEDFRASFILAGDGMVVVNRYGERVVSETASYHDVGKSFFQWDQRTSSYANIPLIAIWDADTAARYGVDALGNPIPAPDADPYWVITADTLDELEVELAKRVKSLTKMLGRAELDPAFGKGLRETLDRFAHFAETGVDEDFGRGSTPSQVALGGFFGLGEGVNPTMRTLADQGPYHAAILGPGLFETVGGAVTDPHGRLIRQDGSVIPGLYGVGTCVAGPWGEAAWSGGHNVGYVLVSAFRAASHAASQGDRTSVPEVAGA